MPDQIPTPSKLPAKTQRRAKTHTRKIEIRCSADEKKAWQEKASEAGVSLSDLVRQSLERTHTWTAADRQLIQAQTRQLARIGVNLNQLARWANTYTYSAEAVTIIAALIRIEDRLDQLIESPRQVGQ